MAAALLLKVIIAAVRNPCLFYFILLVAGDILFGVADVINVNTSHDFTDVYKGRKLFKWNLSINTNTQETI